MSVFPPRTAPWSSIVIATPVLPSGRVGTTAGFAAGASPWALRPVAAPAAVAVASAPAWRNVRRSVRSASPWPIPLTPFDFGDGQTRVIVSTDRPEHKGVGPVEGGGSRVEGTDL